MYSGWYCIRDSRQAIGHIAKDTEIFERQKQVKLKLGGHLVITYLLRQIANLSCVGNPVGGALGEYYVPLKKISWARGGVGGGSFVVFLKKSR